VGSGAVDGTLRTQWRDDLPGFAPGSAIATVRGSDVKLVNAVNLQDMQTIKGGASDFWYFFAWNGFRPRSAGLDQPVTFGTSDSTAPTDTTPAVRRDSLPPPPIRDTAPTLVVPPANLTPPPVSRGYVVSFAAVLTQQKADELAAGITIDGAHPKVVATSSGATKLFRVVLGPYPTREEAERVGRDSKRQYWVYEASQ
jgi:hypothetical protein